MLNRRLLNINQLAPILNRSTSWIYQNYKLQIKKHGFPEPVPGFGCLWDEQAIDAWLNMHISSKYKLNDNKPDASFWEEYLKIRAANL